MNPNSNPLEYLIQCCEDASNTGHWKLTPSHIFDAKNELQKLRQKLVDSYQELFNCNQDLVEETNKNLDYKEVAWARINERGDLFDLRLQCNPHLDPKTIIPLYRLTNGSDEK